MGVYICQCGSSIPGAVDVQQVACFCQRLATVALAQHHEHMCNLVGQNMIKEAYPEAGAQPGGCCRLLPEVHEPTFSRVCEDAGLNRYLFQMASIREHCSWVIEDRRQATEKAKALVSAAVKRVYYHESLEIKEIPVNPHTLIVGGGIAGIEAALTIADAGYKVYLVEREPSIGGNIAQFDKIFPTLDCAACILTPKMTSEEEQDDDL